MSVEAAVSKGSNDVIVKKLLKSSSMVMTFSMMVSVIGMMVDGVIIGRYLGTDRIAAYGLISPVLVIISLIGALLSSGAVTNISQYVAKGEKDKIDRVFSMTVIEGILIFVVVSFVIWNGRNWLCALLGAVGTSEFLKPLMIDYLKGLIPCFPIIILSEFLSHTMQLEGNRKFPMIGIFIMFIADIVLDLANVYIVKWDMFGMALATSISYFCSCIVYILHFVSKKSNIVFRFRGLPWKQAGTLLVMGLPSALGRLCNALRSTLINYILVTFASSVAVAAFSVNNSAGNLMNAVGNGVAGACLMLAGLFVADKDEAGLKNLLKNGIKYAFFISCGVGALFFIFSSQIAGLFLTGDMEAVREAAVVIKCYAVYVPFFAVNALFYNYLQGIQNTRYASILTVLCNGGLIVVVAFILGSRMGTMGVWISFPIGGFLGFLSVVAAAWIYQGHLPRGIASFAFLPKGISIPKENMIENSITEKEQVSVFAEEVDNFCMTKRNDRRKALFASLCVEEMVNNIFEHGFERNKNPSVDVRIVKQQDDFIIRIRDNGIPFNPKEYYELVHDEDVTAHIGIRMVFREAKSVTYTNTMNTNNLIIVM